MKTTKRKEKAKKAKKAKKPRTRTIKVESRLPVLEGFYERILISVLLPKHLVLKLDALKMICKSNGDRLVKSTVISEALEAYLPKIDPNIVRMLAEHRDRLAANGMLRDNDDFGGVA